MRVTGCSAHSGCLSLVQSSTVYGGIRPGRIIASELIRLETTVELDIHQLWPTPINAQALMHNVIDYPLAFFRQPTCARIKCEGARTKSKGMNSEENNERRYVARKHIDAV